MTQVNLQADRIFWIMVWARAEGAVETVAIVKIAKAGLRIGAQTLPAATFDLARK